MALLLLCILALTAGELWQYAGGWSISFELAREGSQSAYQSVFWLGQSVQQVAAPLLLARALDAGTVGWLPIAS